MASNKHHTSNSSDSDDSCNEFYVIARYVKIPKKRGRKTTKVYLTNHHLLDYYMLFNTDKRAISNNCKFKSIEEAKTLIVDLTKYVSFDPKEFCIEVY